MTYFWTSAHLRKGTAYIRGYSNGKLFSENVDIEPYLFVESKKNGGDYKTLDGTPCAKVEFKSVTEAREFLSTNEGISNRPIYGMTNFLYTYLNDNFPGTVEHDPALIARCTIDIETMADGSFPNIKEADKEITGLTFSHRKNGVRKIAMFGCRPYTPTNPEVRYRLCKNETELLEKFIELWNDPDWTPDILTGWYIEGFDVPYIVNRIRRILGDGMVKMLSPWRIVNEREIARGQSVGASTSTQTVYEIFGISVLDYMELYKKFSFKNQESWSLNAIARHEKVGEKDDYSHYGSLHEFYLKDYQGYMDYNLQDVLLVDKIDEKVGFIDLVLAFAYDAKVTYNDTMTTTRPWDVIIHNYLLEQKIVVPQSLGSGEPRRSIIGGYVKSPIIGMSRDVVSFDFDSLYPHLIMGWNISPETVVGRVEFNAVDSFERGTFDEDVAKFQDILKEKDAILAGNGYLFSRSRRGFLPVLMDRMYADRVEYQKLKKAAKPGSFDFAKYDNLQKAKKIQLNSAFGALANEFYRWFANHLAEAITTSGQMSTRWTASKINEFLNKVLKTSGIDFIIASDTDSVYVTLEQLRKVSLGEPNKTEQVIDFLDTACKKSIEKQIEKACIDLTKLVGCPTNKLKMKRETIANKGIWTAKKRYILNVWDAEGKRYEEPELKITGIESVRSSTPMICRDKIKEALTIIMNKDETTLQSFVADFKKEFKTKNFHEVAFPRGISGMNKYSDAARIYAKGCPIQVRGALLYNKLILDLGLSDKYQPIHDKAKIKFAYLRVPNPIRENVISVPDVLPPEFELDKFVDHELQFEKTFLDPVTTITDAIGWQTEKKTSLMDFI